MAVEAIDHGPEHRKSGGSALVIALALLTGVGAGGAGMYFASGRTGAPATHTEAQNSAPVTAEDPNDPCSDAYHREHARTDPYWNSRGHLSRQQYREQGGAHGAWVCDPTL